MLRMNFEQVFKAFWNCLLPSIQCPPPLSLQFSGQTPSPGECFAAAEMLPAFLAPSRQVFSLPATPFHLSSIVTYLTESSVSPLKHCLYWSIKGTRKNTCHKCIAWCMFINRTYSDPGFPLRPGINGFSSQKQSSAPKSPSPLPPLLAFSSLAILIPLRLIASLSILALDVTLPWGQVVGLHSSYLPLKIW